MLAILKSNWHFMRILRLVLGGIAISQYFSMPDPLLLILGGVFVVQGIFNIGCCGAGACEWTPDGKKTCDK
jgi:uncharacterized membrane protein HdeD (DUF308 family)